MIDINEGYTNNYLVHGVFTIAVGAPLIYFHFLFWLPFIIIAIALFTSSNGLLIDIGNKRYKAYGNILGYKMGKWKSLKNVETMVLKFSSVSQLSVHPMILGTMKPKSFKSFNLIAGMKDGNQFTLYEFIKYTTAKKGLTAIETCNGIQIKDMIAEKLVQNRTNPRR